jgi:hypothetical protein
MVDAGGGEWVPGIPTIKNRIELNKKRDAKPPPLHMGQKVEDYQTVDVYEGTFSEGRPANFTAKGTGTYAHANGRTYTGPMKDGQFHGFGEMHFEEKRGGWSLQR